jgi:tetratricopeptide (TPR) repeat protein
MASIVFIGNCQLEGMSNVYREFVAGRTGEKVHHVPSHVHLTAAARDMLLTADIVVSQVQDLQPVAGLDALHIPGHTVLIPTVTAHFLWPYNKMERHPRAVDDSYFAPDLGDSYLNQAIHRGDDPELTVQQYLELDIAKSVNLDRMFELIIDRQQSRDQRSGFDMADYIVSRFRDDYLFMTPYHMCNPTFLRLMTQLLQKLDIHQNIIRRLNKQLKTAPFVPDYLPIHPSVRRHFGLTFIGDDHAYKCSQVKVSARTFYLRYMQHDWNPDFVYGRRLALAGRNEEALIRLQAAVQHAPDCAYGFNLIAIIHRQHGDMVQARQAIDIAIELVPNDARSRDTYANILAAEGDLAGAEKMLEIAVRLARDETHCRMLLAGMLWRQGKLQEAILVTEAAIRLDPYAMPAHWTMIMLTKQTGNLDLAEALLMDALALDPDDGPLHYALAELRHAQGDGSAALDAIRTALALAPGDKHVEDHCAVLLAKSVCLAEAVQEISGMIRRNGSNASHHDCLAHLLERQGKFDAARAAQHRAVELAPQNQAYAQYEEHLLRCIARTAGARTEQPAAAGSAR